MTSSPRLPAAERRVPLLAALLALIWMARPAGAASQAGWTVTVKGLDATRAADPVLANGVLLVDAAALGPSLRLRVRAAGHAVSLLDPQGVEWRGTAGDALLAAPDRTLPLARPLRVEGRSVYLPAAAVAELAGLRLALDPGARTAAFVDRRAAPRSTASEWETFTMAKPAVPGSPAARRPGAGAELVLPPSHDTLRLAAGIGAVPGEDWGGELTATGAVRGLQAGMDALLTSGPRGVVLQSGHAVLSDPERGWGAEAGDLFSEIWGFASGARVRWRRGDGDRGWSPTLSLYLDDPRAGNEGPVLAYGDELRLGRSFSVAGELASDGSWLASGRLRRDHMSLFGYRRVAGGRFDASGSGLAGSLELPLGASLQASLARSEAAGRPLDMGAVALRVPLPAGADLTVESSRSSSATARVRTDGLAASAPLGRLQVRGRYQRREVAIPVPSSGTSRFAVDELLAAATFRAGPRLRLEAQLAERWPMGGERHEWRQIAAWGALSPRTTLHLFAAASSSGHDDAFRARLDHEVRPGLSLFAEYGDVVTFQEPLAGPGDERARLRVMVRRTWDVATPAAGGEVAGVVGGPGELTAAGLPVELGPYRTLTDPAGRYAFPNVPPGRYELRLAEAGLPAAFAAGAPSPVEVQRGRNQRVDLPLVPLGEVRGWVYVDRDRDGRRDMGEGAAGVVLVLDERATASAADGSFAFQNLPPGAHSLRLETGRLTAGLEALIPSQLTLGLPAGGAIDHVEFRLQERAKPVVLQEVLR